MQIYKATAVPSLKGWEAGKHWVALIAASNVVVANRIVRDELTRRWPGVEFGVTLQIAHTDYAHIMLAALEPAP